MKSNNELEIIYEFDFDGEAPNTLARDDRGRWFLAKLGKGHTGDTMVNDASVTPVQLWQVCEWWSVASEYTRSSDGHIGIIMEACAKQLKRQAVKG